jgi:hypothetical protein
MELSRRHCGDHRVSRDIHLLCIRTDWLRTVQDDHVQVCLALEIIANLCT